MSEERLRRAYERLMWAYPRWYRRERGVEIVTALLDDAPPGQRRPTRTDVVDLLVGGVRARLRPPRHLGIRLICVLVALYVAIVGAAAAVLVSGVTGPPSDARAIAAAAAAVPVQPHNVPGPPIRCNTVCPVFDGTDAVVAYQGPPDRLGRTIVYLQVPGDEAVRARDRLVAAGWQVGPLRTQSDGFLSFDASASGLDVTVTGWPDGLVTVAVRKSFQAAALVPLVAGLVAGFAAGWLAVVWAVQRYRRQPLVRQWFIVLAATPLLMIALFTVWVVVVLGFYTGVRDPSAKMINLPLVAFPGFWWPILGVAAVSAVVTLTLVVTGAAGPSRDRPNPVSA